MELFPPLVAQVMLVLVGVIGVVSLVVGAYNWSTLISGRSQFRKIEVLEQDVAKLQREIKTLNDRLAECERKMAAPKETEPVPAGPQAAEPEELWSEFVSDYNSLAASMDVPKALHACATFAETYRLSFLICVDHAARENGQIAPKFTAVDQLEQSTYWCWPVPDTIGAFVVVPNPLNAYDEDLHNEGGMKETFASNYESGCCKEIRVRLPAKFQQQGGNWKIIQPGVIKVK